MTSDVVKKKIYTIGSLFVAFTIGTVVGFFVAKNISKDTNVTIEEVKSIEDEFINDDVIVEDSNLIKKDDNNTIVYNFENNNIGDIVKYGKYEQDDNIYNGKEDVEWVVLYKSNKRSIFLVSRYILDCLPYNFNKNEITWEDSYIRNYLNNDFYNDVFSDEEKNMIMENEMSNNDNINYKTDAGNETKDKVFLLSESQARKYFAKSEKNGQNKSRATYPTAYTVQKGININFDEKEWNNGCAPYWLRTPGVDNLRTEIIDFDGSIYQYGEDITNVEVGIRPCIWLKY